VVVVGLVPWLLTGLFGRLVLVLYAAAVAAAFVVFVQAYEEPTLARQFGADYEAYRRAVPGWWPRRPTGE
jgi:protein-S-isoprenylcysteine O-methyltransferase Ste14